VSIERTNSRCRDRSTETPPSTRATRNSAIRCSMSQTATRRLTGRRGDDGEEDASAAVRGRSPGNDIAGPTPWRHAGPEGRCGAEGGGAGRRGGDTGGTGDRRTARGCGRLRDLGPGGGRTDARAAWEPQATRLPAGHLSRAAREGWGKPSASPQTSPSSHPRPRRLRRQSVYRSLPGSPGTSLPWGLGWRWGPRR
jgi:hypothetical protein